MSAATLVTGFVKEKMRNSVSSVMGVPVSRSARPNASSWTISPRRATRLTAPAMRR